MARRIPWRRNCPDVVLNRIEEAIQARIYLLRETGPTGFLLKEDGLDKKFKVCWRKQRFLNNTNKSHSRIKRLLSFTNDTRIQTSPKVCWMHDECTQRRLKTYINSAWLSWTGLKLKSLVFPYHKLFTLKQYYCCIKKLDNGETNIQ